MSERRGELDRLFYECQFHESQEGDGAIPNIGPLSTSRELESWSRGFRQAITFRRCANTAHEEFG